MKSIRTVLLLAIFMTTGCGCGSNAARGGAVGQDGQEQKPEFKMVEVPISITSAQGRAEYLLAHYWDNYDYRDTSLINCADATEQGFVNFLDVMKYGRDGAVSLGIRNNLDGALGGDSIAVGVFRDYYERYLWDPNSPMRNEEVYILYLREVMASPKIADVDKIRAEYQLEQAMKNRVGTVAHDFRYRGIGGNVGTLHGMRGKDYTLLFFYNPDCPACSEIKTEVLSSGVVSALIHRGALRVLAVYTDEDLELWRSRAGEMPKGWAVGATHGVDAGIMDNYDLKAIPTIYLLDSQHNVLIKDATVWQVEDFLRSL